MYRLDATSEDRLARAIDRWYPERLEFEQLADENFAQAAQTIGQELHMAIAVSPFAPRK
jgi:succinylarginine dihydrolase